MPYVILCFLFTISCNGRKGSKQTNADTVSVTGSSVKELNSQIERDASNPELYYQRSVIYFNEKNPARALNDIDQALIYNTQNPLYHYFRGKILYAMNQTLKAADAFETAIRLKPDYTEAKLKAAELYYIVKEHQKSLSYLNSIIAIEPSNSMAYLLKGMNLKEMKDTVKALDAFQTAYEYDKNFYDALMQLGLIYSAKNNRIAADYFSSAIRTQPKNEEAYFARGVFFQNNKKYDEALMDYRKVIAINPSNIDAYYNVGYINFDTKHFDEAIRNWDQCIQMNNGYTRAYYMRGLAHEIKGNKDKAKLNYEYVLQLDPTYELAKEGLKRIKK